MLQLQLHQPLMSSTRHFKAWMQRTHIFLIPVSVDIRVFFLGGGAVNQKTMHTTFVTDSSGYVPWEPFQHVSCRCLVLNPLARTTSAKEDREELLGGHPFYRFECTWKFSWKHSFRWNF